MKLLLLGATGRVGSRVLEHLLADGHQVTALVRTPEKVQVTHPLLTVIQGDVRQVADLEQAMQGTEAVFSSLSTDGGTTLTDSMPLIIEGMRKHGIKRIVTIGTAGILQSRTEPELLRYLSSESKRALTRAAEEHHQVYTMLAESGLDWTIVCPTYLPDEEPLGVYRLERDFLPEGGGKIAVADTAEFAYRQLMSEEYLHARVGIAY